MLFTKINAVVEKLAGSTKAQTAKMGHKRRLMEALNSQGPSCLESLRARKTSKVTEARALG